MDTQPRILKNTLLEDREFWKGKNVEIPHFDRINAPVRSVCFSAGRMAYGHTGDILQDIIEKHPDTGTMVGVESHACGAVVDLAACDYMMTQLIYENQEGVLAAKVQGAISSVLFTDQNSRRVSWLRLMELARDPRLQFATINAPEVVYGVAYEGGDFAEARSDVLKKDMEEGTICSDPAKWTAFALERYRAGLNFSMVSCTNFSGNGHYTGATLRTVARAWQERGYAPQGFVDYLQDPSRFAFPNCMIDRIAVPPDDRTREVMETLSVISPVVVTEKTRYWAVEDLFPAGRPAFEDADGVIMAGDYEEVKKYEDMKLRILNMSHSVIAHLGVLLGYRGAYGIYRAMQDEAVSSLIKKIIDIVVETIAPPEKMDPREFGRDAIERLNNPNIPDDPMRIAFNGSTKMLPRFLDTYFAAQKKGMPEERLGLVLLPVAAFLRYTLGIDDSGASFSLEDDPIKGELEACGSQAKIGEPASAAAFDRLVSRPDVMGKDLFGHGQTGEQLKELTARMLSGTGSVRTTLVDVLGNE